MPIYEYVCTACNNSFDKICRAGIEDNEIQCPRCKEYQAKRKMSLFSFGSRSSSGEYKSSSSSKNCSSCSSHSCSTCG